MNKEEYDIRTMLLLLLHKLWFIISALLISGSATCIISKYVLTPQYSSYTTVYVNNRGEEDVNTRDAKNHKANLNDLQASQTLLNTYIAVLQSDSVMEKIKIKLQNSCTAEELLQAFNVSQIKDDDIKKSFSMAAVDNTEVLKITATTGSPEISAKICNIIAEIAPDFLTRIVGAGSVEIIDLAQVNSIPSSPKILKNTFIGMICGMIVAISSANPGEGKSTIAANLAIALMQKESKVLLIDGDLRKSVQHKIFKADDVDGLSTLIIGKSTLEESIKVNILNNLDLLPAGPTPPNPSELLASKRFRKLLEKFSQKYDYVIIDTPPINLVSDALVFKDLLNGIVLVIKHAVTTQEDIEYCVEQISLSNINVFGFVINDICSRHNSDYYKNY